MLFHRDKGLANQDLPNQRNRPVGNRRIDDYRC
jgi:hypothetical protein